MAMLLTVQSWKSNEPKLVKHSEWEKDVVPALASWESFKKNVDGLNDHSPVINDHVMLKKWGEALEHALKVKHDWLNKVVHAESRRKVEELQKLLNQEMQVYLLKAQAFAAEEKKKADLTRTPNTGRPLPKLPPSKNDVLTQLERNH